MKGPEDVIDDAADVTVGLAGGLLGLGIVAYGLKKVVDAADQDEEEDEDE